jgi:hypothetical protein
MLRLVTKGTAETVKLLCEKGAQIDPRDSAGDRPLCLACLYGHLEVVWILNSHRALLRLMSSSQSYEDFPLCLAAKEGCLAIVSLLIDRSASVTQKDELGWQPLRYATHQRHPEVLRLLLQHDATLTAMLLADRALAHSRTSRFCHQ